MQKNLYYRGVIRRRNFIAESFFGLFIAFSSYPRLLLEVFIRKNFGDRYFTLASVITVAVVLAFLPVLFDTLSDSYYMLNFSDTLSSHKTWYLFILVFLTFGIIRYREIKRNPSVFDFGRYSLSSGDITPFFYRIHLFGRKPSIRTIETLYEPGMFFIIGGLLSLLHIGIGPLLNWASIFYSLGYIGDYKKGDDFVKDKIDEMIMNEDMQESFVDNEDQSSRGITFRAEKPSSRELRSSLAAEFIVDTKESEAVAEAF